MEWLDLAADAVAVATSVTALFLVRRTEVRRARDRDRADRLYQRVDKRLAAHIQSRLH